MEYLINILHEGNHSLVVANGDVSTFDGRGVADLFYLLKANPDFLDGADVADKVVGKGAAAIMILGQIHAVHADVISEPALRLLRQSSVMVSYEEVVPNIINRKGDGICPVETICMECTTAEECLPLITQFINSNITK
ncbi:MAG: DUF1893 domain-containing protein [Clostridiales bacterium]|nr:DUF1893 domain-containing protein [Clostridiales bacterium]